MKEQFPARMLRIHFGEDDLWQGKPLHEAILAKCKELNIAEAIVFRGIEGYGSGSRIRRSGHWSLSLPQAIAATEVPARPVTRSCAECDHPCDPNHCPWVNQFIDSTYKSEMKDGGPW